MPCAVRCGVLFVPPGVGQSAGGQQKLLIRMRCECGSPKQGSLHFTIREGTEDLDRGTRITLHFKEDCVEPVDATKLKALVKQYSEFISFPIQLYTSSREPIKIEDTEATSKKQKEENETAEKEEREAKTINPVTKTEYEDGWDWEVQNEMSRSGCRIASLSPRSNMRLSTKRSLESSLNLLPIHT